jgi:hypothetical protein
MVVAESAFLGLYHKAGLVAAVGRREYLGGRVVFLSVFGRGSSPVEVQAGPRAVRCSLPLSQSHGLDLD